MKIKIATIDPSYDNKFYTSLNQTYDDYHDWTKHNKIDSPIFKSEFIIKKNRERNFRYLFGYEFLITVIQRKKIQNIQNATGRCIMFNPNFPIESLYKNMFDIYMVDEYNHSLQQFTIGVVIPFQNSTLASIIAKAKLKIHLEKEQKNLKYIVDKNLSIV